MHTGDYTQCKTLGEFERALHKDLINAHGETYRDVVFELAYYSLRNPGNVVKELGIMQGSSMASIMILGSLTKMIGVDIDTSRFEPYRNLFETYAKEKNIDFKIIQADSASEEAAAEPCDLLHIDSLHKPSHLVKELNIHAPNVRKAIFFHDTNLPGMREIIKSWMTNRSNEIKFARNEWRLYKESKDNVGYMIIERYNLR